MTGTALLVLEDGAVFRGRSFGAVAPKTSVGEVVFCTAMTGYQEALTDPSYAGQILVMTAPMIGNYGVGPEDLESEHPQVAGFAVREVARRRSNQRSDRDLGDWLAAHGIGAIEGIDTRALVRRLRIAGALRGVLSTDPHATAGELLAMARSAPQMTGCNLAAAVGPREVGTWDEDLGVWRLAPAARPERPYRVVALDCGAKRNIYRNLVDRGCEVLIAPHDLDAAAIRAMEPEGVIVSNGPGDPAAVSATIETLAAIAGEIPTFGICLGHQLLALALGATTFKLKFGHRGANQPVHNLQTGRVEITSQNHGFCVDPASLDAIGCEVTHIHLNDGTLAGFRHRELPIFSVQFHPEASPGPHDSRALFDDFVALMESRRCETAAPAGVGSP